MSRTAILVTVHNRRDTTLLGLQLLNKAIAKMNKEQYLFDIFLVDDGSTDGTYESISNIFPEIHLYRGDGSLFWVHGMQMAWEKAKENADYDYYLWFNDDNKLYENALVLLYESSDKNEDSVICGAFCYHDHRPSFCGRDKMCNILEPNGDYQEIYRMHGNLVLIPRKIFKTVGMFDIKFLHNLGDFDYSLRVWEAGHSVLLTPEYIGINNHHDDELLNHLKEIPFIKRWKMLHTPKHAPKYSFHFHKKHMGLAIALKDYVNQYLYIFFPSYLDFQQYLKTKNIKWLKPFLG